MIKSGVVALALGAALLLGSIDSHAQDTGQELVNSLTGGDAGLLLRYRYEFVDDERFSDNANASTLLLRLNYETAEFRNWTGKVEFDYVFEVLLKDFNSGAGTSGDDRDRFPVVADPEGPDLNQLYLQYAPSEQFRTRIGRQRINLDDQRFVGGVFWRQNEQTYDSLSFKYDGWQNTSFFYAFVVNVNRIFGQTVPAGSHKQNTHLLNARFDINKDFKVIGYGYLIDNDDAPAFSTNTFGIRAEGGLEVGGGRLSLLGELATQSDTANNPANFSTNYYRLQAIWKPGKVSAGIGYEVLGSDNNQGFRTPLATLHKFNGFADLFLTTPAAGLKDFYLRGGVDVEKWVIDARYHNFTADAGSGDFGSEFDIQAKRPLGKHVNLLLKAAFFRSDSVDYPDVTKFWVMFTSNF